MGSHMVLVNCCFKMGRITMALLVRALCMGKGDLYLVLSIITRGRLGITWLKGKVCLLMMGLIISIMGNG